MFFRKNSEMSFPCVGFVLCSSVLHPIPSTRIAVLNMLPYLQATVWQTRILFEPSTPNETPDLSGVAGRAVEAGCNVVVLQKVKGAGAVALAQQLRAAGIRTVYMVCDLVDVPMAAATDATIVVTDYLKSLYPSALQDRIHSVHDGIERPDACTRYPDTRVNAGSGPLQAVLVTSAALRSLPALGQMPPWLRVRIVGRYASGIQRWREQYREWVVQPQARLAYLHFLANQNISCVPWHADGVYLEMQQADVGIIPIDTYPAVPNSGLPPSWKVKSENRLTMKMSIGLPVIATPIPSYEPIIEHGVNGFFASSVQDWQTCLRALRDPARRHEMGKAARISVAEKYSMHTQAVKLLQVLQMVYSPSGA
jgi:hypothetical protein